MAEQEEPRAHQVLDQLVDERVLIYVERHREPLAPPRPPMVRAQREPRFNLDPDRWGTGFLAVRERELPPELHDDLREVTPQAILRDLHRPVRKNYWIEREPLEENPNGLALRTFAALRETRRPEPVEPLAPITRAIREAQLQRRAMLAEPWQPFRRDDEKRIHPRASTVSFGDQF